MTARPSVRPTDEPTRTAATLSVGSDPVEAAWSGVLILALLSGLLLAASYPAVAAGAFGALAAVAVTRLVG